MIFPHPGVQFARLDLVSVEGVVHLATTLGVFLNINRTAAAFPALPT
jgi:hypothetical protein